MVRRRDIAGNQRGTGGARRDGRAKLGKADHDSKMGLPPKVERARPELAEDPARNRSGPSHSETYVGTGVHARQK